MVKPRMVTLGKYVVVWFNNFTHSNKNAFEWNNIIYNNEMPQTKLHTHILEKSSTRAAEDSLVTGTSTTICDISQYHI